MTKSKEALVRETNANKYSHGREEDLVEECKVTSTSAR
jgi:hypothetical protein